MQTIWKGSITFGLVNVPVKLFTATEDNNVPMKMIHKKFGEPIRYSRTCPKCDGDVRWDEIVKGYEYEPGHFVTFEKEELAELASEDKREIRILDFVDLEEIDPIYFQKTYYIAPDESGVKAYKLLRQALAETGKIGVANITMRQKSSLAAIRFLERGMAMSTMFYADEIRPQEQVPNLPKDEKVNEKELEMAKMLIEQLAAPFEPDKYEDEFNQRLMQAVNQKIEGKDVKIAPQEKRANVIDMMDALQASLAAMKKPENRGKDAKSANTKAKPKADTRKPKRKTGTDAKRTGA